MEPTLPSVAHCGGTLGALVEGGVGGIEQSATAQGVEEEAKREGPVCSKLQRLRSGGERGGGRESRGGGWRKGTERGERREAGRVGGVEETNYGAMVFGCIMVLILKITIMMSFSFPGVSTWVQPCPATEGFLSTRGAALCYGEGWAAPHIPWEIPSWRGAGPWRAVSGLSLGV